MATNLKSKASADVMPTASVFGDAIPAQEVHLGEVDGPSQLPAKLPPNAPFYIATHPLQVHVSAGLLIPAYKVIPVEAGVEGAFAKGGKVVMDGPKGIAARRGYTVLPTAIGGSSYLTSINVPGGVHYMTIWETARSGEKVTDFDERAYHDWIWALIKSGKVPGPSLTGLRNLRKDVQARHLKNVTKTKLSAESEAIADETDKALKMIDAEIARLVKATPVIAPSRNASVDLD